MLTNSHPQVLQHSSTQWTVDAELRKWINSRGKGRHLAYTNTTARSTLASTADPCLAGKGSGRWMQILADGRARRVVVHVWSAGDLEQG